MLKFENGSSGGGGGETLAQTLAIGNLTGANNIQQQDNSKFKKLPGSSTVLNFESSTGELHTNTADANSTTFVTNKFNVLNLLNNTLMSLDYHVNRYFQIGATSVNKGLHIFGDDTTNTIVATNIAKSVKFGINKTAPTVALDVVGDLNLVNNANFLINSTQVFEDSGETTYSGTIVWDGTAPTTILNQTYRWTRIGKMVSLRINVSYSVAGVTNTTVTLTLPSGAPTPQDPSGFAGASNIAYMATGSIGTGPGNSGGGNTRCFLGPNAVPNGYLLSVIASSPISAKVVRFSVDYFIA